MFVEVVRFARSNPDVGLDASDPIGPRAADLRESLREWLRRNGGIHRRTIPILARIVLGVAVLLLTGAVMVASVEVVNAGARLIAGAAIKGGPPAARALALDLTAAPGFVAPRLMGPAEVVTNSPTFHLTGTIAPEIAGRRGYFVRVYRDASVPTLLQAIAVGGIPWFDVPDIALSEGTNTFIATLVGPSGETVPSNAVRVVFTTAKPEITLTSPEAGAKVAERAVEVTGTVPVGAFVVVRNTTSGNGGVAAATTDGVFSATVPLAIGANDVLVTVTDQAGNSNSTEVTLTRVRSGSRGGGETCGRATTQGSRWAKPGGGTPCQSGATSPTRRLASSRP